MNAGRKRVKTGTHAKALRNSSVAGRSHSANRATTKRRISVPQPTKSAWTFLTNHSHVLILLSRDPTVVLREVALQVGITERAVQKIIADLEAGGIIEREKVGRQNHYRIRADKSLRHPIEAHRTIAQLLALINRSTSTSR